MPETQNLLFLCTGNYYRSRCAEALFNHLALLDRIEWRASSRGLNPKREQTGLSPLARDFLLEHRIPLQLTSGSPRRVTDRDLAEASLVVALDETEHRPILRERFPLWENRVDYWQIPDIDVTPSEIALPRLRERVLEWFDLIREGCARGVGDGVCLEF